MKLRCIAILLVVFASLLSGCRLGGSQKSYLNENDKLRRENLELKQKIEKLESQNASLKGGNEQLAAKLARALDLPESARLDQLPTPARISVGRYSGAIDTDRDGNFDLIRIYIAVYDQNDRFVPLGATASAQAVAINPPAAPRVIASVDLTADEFEAAYRPGGFTGPHYTIELPLSGVASDVAKANVTISITPLTSDKAMTTETTIELKKSNP